MKQFILFILVLLPVCAFAQFTETFDGPEINSNNPWKGGLDKFTINSGGWLQLNGVKNEAGKAGLHCVIPYASTMQWEFDVCMEEVPSEKNYLRLYLYMAGDDTYYYVQIGHDGAKKISLRTNDKEELFPPKESGLTGKPVLLHIKVTLENDEVWTLYSRRQGDSYYRLEGSTDKYPIKVKEESGELTLNIEYTKTRYRHFAIDNLNVSHNITPIDTIPSEEPENPDPEEPVSPVVLPKLLSVQPLNLCELQFTFDRPVDISEAWFMISEIGKADRIGYADERTKTVVNTKYPEEMVAGVNYTITYDGLTDMEGNKLVPFSEEFVLEGEDGEEVEPGSILINEIMADPKGLEELPETEYVELYNTTDNVFVLTDWQFSYGGKAKPMTTFEIPAKGYAVLYRSGRDIVADPSAVKVPLDNFPSALANTGKLLQLFDGDKNLIDEVTYEKATPAKSWERSSSGWHLSSDPRGGTPGSVNSSGKGEEKPNEPDKPVTPDDPDEPDTPDDPSLPDITVEPGEFVFNELLPNPFAGGSEYIELYNRSDRALPVSGLSVAVRKADGTLNTRYPLSSVTATIESDGYVLLTKNLEGVTDFYTIQSPSSLFEVPKLPILANTSSTLVLFRTKDGTVIDEVSYTSKWHASSIKDQKGVSLERIDPDAGTQSPSNWTSASATVGYGTPGYPNSQSDISLPDDPDTPDEPTGIKTPQWDESAGHYTISYYLDQPGYNCRAFVFNIAGQRVAQIANHELLGLTGKLTWDGYALSGRQLQTGVYIFYAELYHTSGTVKRYKQVFLVR
ncbi:lamin tail domain-containing protein [uncultured Parabacteroides sp.]|uniref:lamin tail domain-containing protein n=1 Tax=uncultured Parabacteroides sp. TaxID=512312 RepID=UPI002591F958|nr:lamin tail domain-containing protein [uncultured Parabacteroides sp.]